MREAELETYFRRRVQLSLGGLCLKLAPTVKGMPDRLVLLPGGRMHLVELKTPTGRTSASQRHLHDVLAKLGIHVAVLYGPEEVTAWVRERAEEGYQATRYKRRKKPEEAAS